MSDDQLREYGLFFAGEAGHIGVFKDVAEINEIVGFVISNKNINKMSLSEEIRKIFNFYFTSIYNSINEFEEDVASKILEKCRNIL